MKNIHILPTEKSSRIIKSQDNDFILLNTNVPNWFEINLNTTKQNIYITSDEYIGLSYYLDGNLIRKGVVDDKNYWELRKDYVKIILTTDPKLIKDGVQAIDDDFLEWFVKNPSCEEVEIEQEILKLVQSPNYVNHTPAGDGIYLTPKNEDLQYGETLIEDNIFDYKIIIPREEVILQSNIDGEPKQEALEEAGLKHCDILDKFPALINPLFSFKEGAKWQQERMYSEEEVTQLLIKFNQEIQEVEDVREWFKQFKKK